MTAEVRQAQGDQQRNRQNGSSTMRFLVRPRSPKERQLDWFADSDLWSRIQGPLDLLEKFPVMLTVIA